MNPELKALYHEMILEHGRHPRNFKVLEDATHSLEGFNPLCGDRLTLYLKVGHLGVIEDVSFQGKGCAISIASASLMTESMKGKTLCEAEVLFKAFHDMVVGNETKENRNQKWCVLAGVREFPARVKCATLAWHTLIRALQGEHKTISTEEDSL